MNIKLSALMFALNIVHRMRGWWVIAALMIAVNSWALDAPVNVKAYAGGGNVVVVWPRSVSTDPVYYQIFRDGQSIGFQQSVPVGTPVASFVDSATLIKNTAYAYTVVAKNAQTLAVSPASASAYVKIPAVDVPVPNVQLDYSSAPTTQNYVTQLKAALQLWYPKIAVLIAAPNYMPPTAIGLRVVGGGCNYSMMVADDYWIHVCAAHAMFRGNQFNHEDINVVVHEGTHLMQSYFSGVPSLDEGVATWAGDLTEQKYRAIPGEEMSFLNGYEYSAAFYSWIMSHYPNSDLVRYLNIQAHDQVMDYNWFFERTGKKVNQLWQEMTNVAMSPPQQLIHGTGLCAQVLDNYGLASRCADVNSQTFVYEPVAQRLRVEAHCVSIDAEAKIKLAACTSVEVRGWVFEQNANYSAKQWGQWRHINSNKCLQLEYIPGSIDKTMPTLNAAPCDTQKWSQVWRPFSA